MVYYIKFYRGENKTASKKAPEDIYTVCEELGYEAFMFNPLDPKASKLKKRLFILTNTRSSWNKLIKKLNKGDTLIYQHPMFGTRLSIKMIDKLKNKGVKCIALVHDLESLRKGINGVVENDSRRSYLSDEVLLKKFDKVICHNKKMHNYLLSTGFIEQQLVDLSIFDYLHNYPIKENSNKLSVCIAGNLAKGKSEYIYHIHDDSNPNLIVNLYGVNYDESFKDDLTIYKGSYSPNELVQHLEGGFGLVWDGNSAQSCLGNTSEYLKYNNPHKTSLYLSAGIPVIIWSQAAMADFIKENNLGILVDNLGQIEEKINQISEKEYQTIKENVCKEAEKLKKGYYTKLALSKCI